MSPENKEASRPVAQNRKARHDYFIEEVFEAGLMLLGSEVKSLRAGRASIVDSYAVERDGALVLINANIPAYEKASKFNHDPTRARPLLMHKREINKLMGKIQAKGYTLVALSLYFNKRGKAKVELALARGKAKYDKRETKKKEDWQREKGRIMRGEK